MSRYEARKHQRWGWTVVDNDDLKTSYAVPKGQPPSVTPAIVAAHIHDGNLAQFFADHLNHADDFLALWERIEHFRANYDDFAHHPEFAAVAAAHEALRPLFGERSDAE